MGGLMGMASSGLGNQLLGAVAGKEAQNAALLGGVLQKIGLDNNQAMMAAPVVIQFLKTRMDAEWVERIMKIVPILSGQEDAPKEEPSVLGALGSLFGS